MNDEMIKEEVTNEVATKEVVISEEVIAEVEEMFDSVEAFISPYRLASFLSALMGRKINPQMMYNYAKNNLLATSLSSTQKLQVSKEDAIKFAAKYVSRNRK